MDNKVILKIADFTKIPVGRYKKFGDFSGEWFRDDILIQKLEEIKKNNQTLIIDLDGTRGYNISFLEEVFGGLVRKGYEKDFLLNTITIKTTNDNFRQWIGIIKECINDAKKDK